MNPMKSETHIPVLLAESVAFLNIQKGSVIIDATLGEGGHTAALLEIVGTMGAVLAIDQDSRMIQWAEKRFGSLKNLILAKGNFRSIEQIFHTHHLASPNGILFDLGVARWHFMGSKRGFSFRDSAEPLSMALSGSVENHTAASLLNSTPEHKLADIFFQYGEVRNSRSIAKAIVYARKKKQFITVGDLLAVLRPFDRTHGKTKMHFATKIFQALRIAVNDELNALQEGLEGAWNIVAPKGRIVVISYHSLEDRMVKNFFKEKALEGNGVIITKKPFIPHRAEIIANPSARSAKLRTIEKNKF